MDFTDQEQSSIHTQIASYISEDLQDLKALSKRQETAITKMSFLKPPEFEDLLNDISDEIYRRKTNTIFHLNDDFTQKRNLSRKKMSKLNDRKFRNLLLDVFLSFNHRFPQTQSTKEIQDLISELATLVISLKNDLEYEQAVIQSIQKESSSKMQALIYNKYIRRVFESNKIDLSVVIFMEKIFQNLSDTNLSTIEALKDPLKFIKLTFEQFKNASEQIQLEHEYHCENIKALLDEDIYEKEVRMKLISKEMSAILQMLICNDLNTGKNNDDLNIEPEINTIITNLEAIKTVMQNNDDSKNEFFVIAQNVLETVAVLQTKLEKIGFVNKDATSKLQEEERVLKECVEKQMLDNIPSAIFNLANLVKTILYSMPVNSSN